MVVCFFFKTRISLPHQFIIYSVVSIFVHGEGLVDMAGPLLLHSLFESEFQSFLVRLLEDVQIDESLVNFIMTPHNRSNVFVHLILFIRVTQLVITARPLEV